jgi:hypothetical protein
MNAQTVKAVKMPPTLTALVRAARDGDEVAPYAALDWLRENGHERLAGRVGRFRWRLDPRDVARTIAEHFHALALEQALAAVRLENVPVVRTADEAQADGPPGEEAALARSLFRTLGLPHVRVAGHYRVHVRPARRGDQTQAERAGGEVVAKFRLILSRAFPGYMEGYFSVVPEWWE